MQILLDKYEKQVTVILDEMEQNKLLLMEHLSSDIEKMKIYWKKWRDKSMPTKEFVKKSIKILGKNFVNLAIKVSPFIL